MTDHAARIAAIACQALDADSAAGRQIEDALRRELGGQHVRISERAPITLDAINAGLRERKPIRVIAAELGVNRATLYRHLKAKTRKSQLTPAV